MTELRVLRRDDPVAGQSDLDEAKAAFDALDPDADASPTLLLTRCWSTAAFTRRDALLPGYGAARAAAVAHGFAPVLRPVGGHLAAYDEGCLVLHLWQPLREAGQGIHDRFERYGEALAGALTTLGVSDVRVGAVPGEYCDGEWSVNVAGRHKLVGTGQRIGRNGFLFSAVVTVSGADRLRAVLIPCYAALGLELDPDTVGAVADAVPGIDVPQVADAVADSLARVVAGAPD